VVDYVHKRIDVDLEAHIKQSRFHIASYSDMAPLSGKKVLVIGASQGIGYAVAKAALAEGALVTISSSSATKLEAAAELLGREVGGDATNSVHGEVLDVKDEKAFGPFFEKVGVVDHLVHTVSDAVRKDVKGIDRR
jgi:NAD(P)-dependent dehydrogenase (short-subunit alcohol dehydrogenase family)